MRLALNTYFHCENPWLEYFSKSRVRKIVSAIYLLKNLLAGVFVEIWVFDTFKSSWVVNLTVHFGSKDEIISKDVMFSGLTNQVSSWMGTAKGEQEEKVPTPTADDGSVNINSEKKDIR